MTIHDVFGASVQVKQHPSAKVPYIIILPRESRKDGSNAEIVY